jgi:DNA-binding transcriptional LysR family regulator
MDVHLRSLRSFVAVAEDLHFTSAARRLFISQPALSKQIRQMERDLGFVLFDRDRHRVTLTPAGELLVPAATAILAQWDEASAAAARRARDGASVLRVGFQTSVAGDLYKRTAALFAERLPEWRVELKMHPWDDAACGLLGDDTDVAFLWLPVPGEEQLAFETLRREARCVAMPDCHPLAGREILSIADLADEPFVALPPEAGPLRDFWLALDEREGRPVRIGAHAATPDDTFEAVAAGQGLALLSQGNAELYARPGITCRPVTDIAPAVLALAWRRNDERAAVAAFAAAASEAAGALQGVSANAASGVATRKLKLSSR